MTKKIKEKKQAPKLPEYNPAKIESKWREVWEKTGINKSEDFSKKPKYYCLDMFPYPSGEGLHVGHWRGYVMSDVWARYKKMQGFNILHPIGWDAFGLPAENAAIKKKIHPKEYLDQNIKKMKSQLQQIGAIYDWSREINTTDPEYYKWTQWIFLKLYKAGLAYKKKMPINWCPSCKTGLANEEVVSGECERCGAEVERKDLEQWMLKITSYADRLLDDLEKLDWPEKVKLMQKNWIGKSFGVEINFKAIKKEIKGKAPDQIIKETEFDIPVFTTRADTLFGVTFLLLSPEHPLVEKLTLPEYKKEVEKYIKKTKKLAALERESVEREKTGVPTGSCAINPINGETIPIWVSDYVLAGYGTGAVMGVPAHDQRDFDFAKKYGFEILEVVAPLTQAEGIMTLAKAYEKDGILINSAEFSGLTSSDAREKIADFLESKNLGRRQINYKIRDWVFSRQRYWGEPIPIIYCSKCGEVPLDEKDLPLLLPEVKKYEPTGTGESPLAAIPEFVNTTCPKCGNKAKRETNTMPQWAGSCWYFLRYCDPKNNNALANPDKLKYWMPVDLYVGGIEHAVLHLLYSRFWIKFLFDIKVIDFDEPFTRLFNQGMIYRHGAKMSKSKGNVVSPDELIGKFGADCIRAYELFIGPPEADAEWQDNGIPGVHRFLKKVWNLSIEIAFNKKIESPESFLYSAKEIKETEILAQMHRVIKKVTNDLERLHFNTIISTLMEYINFLISKKEMLLENHLPVLNLLLLLAPVCPHLAEELWSKFGFKESIFTFSWPKYNPDFIKQELMTIIIQVNGKLRDQIEVRRDSDEEQIKAEALKSSRVQAFITGDIKKVIYVPEKLINIVI